MPQLWLSSERVHFFESGVDPRLWSGETHIWNPNPGTRTPNVSSHRSITPGPRHNRPSLLDLLRAPNPKRKTHWVLVFLSEEIADGCKTDFHNEDRLTDDPVPRVPHTVHVYIAARKLLLINQRPCHSHVLLLKTPGRQSKLKNHSFQMVLMRRFESPNLTISHNTAKIHLHKGGAFRTLGHKFRFIFCGIPRTSTWLQQEVTHQIRR